MSRLNVNINACWEWQPCIAHVHLRGGHIYMMSYEDRTGVLSDIRLQQIGRRQSRLAVSRGISELLIPVITAIVQLITNMNWDNNLVQGSCLALRCWSRGGWHAWGPGTRRSSRILTLVITAIVPLMTASSRSPGVLHVTCIWPQPLTEQQLCKLDFDWFILQRS